MAPGNINSRLGDMDSNSNEDKVMDISEDELARLEAIHCAPSDIEQWAHDCYLCGEELPCDVLRLIAAYRAQVAENRVLRGPMDAYNEDGESLLPRGWVPVDGGRLDELEQAEAERDSLRTELAIQQGGRCTSCMEPVSPIHPRCACVRSELTALETERDEYARKHQAAKDLGIKVAKELRAKNRELARQLAAVQKDVADIHARILDNRADFGVCPEWFEALVTRVLAEPAPEAVARIEAQLAEADALAKQLRGWDPCNPALAEYERAREDA